MCKQRARCNNDKDNGRKRKRDGSFGDKKEKQKILAISSDDDCQSVSEPRIPRMASPLARRTALSVEHVYTKSRGAEPLHSERKARATMGELGAEDERKTLGCRPTKGVARRFWEREPRKIANAISTEKIRRRPDLDD